MRYNFKRLSGAEWYDLIKRLRATKSPFLELNTGDLYNKESVNKIYNVYYARSTSGCKLIYYEYEGTRYHKRLREISFSRKEIDPTRCVLTFRKIASKYNELEPYEPESKIFSNGIYTYYKGKYDGKATVLDMNSAYLWVLTQPLADWHTRTECSMKDVFDKKYDFYSFENDLHCMMFYKEDQDNMCNAMIWIDVKIYGYKSKVFYKKTAEELYRLKCEVDKERYKNVANIAIGCMHKRSGKQNNTTIAASLYAFFAWHIDNLVAKFKNKRYNVIMVTTDSVKIAGDYDPKDNIVNIGNGLGEFKFEYKGNATYYTEGHYEEGSVKWKGKPEYMRDGYDKCLFVDNIEKEKAIYEKYAIV